MLYRYLQDVANGNCKTNCIMAVWDVACNIVQWAFMHSSKAFVGEHLNFNCILAEILAMHVLILSLNTLTWEKQQSNKASLLLLHLYKKQLAIMCMVLL